METNFLLPLHESDLDPLIDALVAFANDLDGDDPLAYVPQLDAIAERCRGLRAVAHVGPREFLRYNRWRWDERFRDRPQG